MKPGGERTSAMPRDRLPLLGGIVLLAIYAAIWLQVPLKSELLRALWFLPPVGTLGAIIA